LYCDLWDLTARDLIEAKATVSREHLRTAVGQLLDYGRFADASQMTVLVPSRPRPDLLAYLSSVGIAAVYPYDDGWERALLAPCPTAEGPHIGGMIGPES
jgi:hypothetical protein